MGVDGEGVEAPGEAPLLDGARGYNAVERGVGCWGVYLKDVALYLVLPPPLLLDDDEGVSNPRAVAATALTMACGDACTLCKTKWKDM